MCKGNDEAEETCEYRLADTQAAKSAVDRINGFLDTIKGNKNYKILASADTQGQIEEITSESR